MGFFDKLFGRKEKEQSLPPTAGPGALSSSPANRTTTPGDNTRSPKEDRSANKKNELSEEERGLLANLGIDEETGLQLKSRTKQKLEGLYEQFWEHSDKEPVLRGISSACGNKEKILFAKSLNERKVNADIHFFGCGGYAGEKKYYVGAVKTTDRYDILRIMETTGVNYEIFTEDIINFFKKWEERIPFSIVECEADAVTIQLKDMNVELEEFATEILEICPDFTSVTETPSELMQYIKNFKGQLDFWWD